MNQIKHLLVTGILRLLNTVQLQRFWRAATTLVKSCNKSLAVAQLDELFIIHCEGSLRSFSTIVSSRAWTVFPQRLQTERHAWQFFQKTVVP